MSLGELIGSLSECKAFMLGEFKLKSGQISPVYIDLRGLISIPSLLKESIEGLWKRVVADDIQFDCICGVPYAALPLACGLCLDHDIPMLMRRKEAKDYGTKKLIEGKILPGSRCLIVEDVVTEGTSIIETVELLRGAGLVVEDAVVLIHRQQGAEHKLSPAGITLHSVIRMDDVLSEMVRAGRMSEERAGDIKSILARGTLKDGAGIPESVSWSLDERSTGETLHPKMKDLLGIVRSKETNLCVAADVTSSHELLELAKKIGSQICILKLHCDIIEDFSERFIVELKKVASDSNFLIMEDRKYSDTGRTVDAQFRAGTFKVSGWADLVTLHSVSGPGVIDGLRKGCESGGAGLVLVAEMSSKGTLTSTNNYIAETVKMGTENRDVVCGFICQKRCLEDPGFLFMTPGIHLSQNKDGLGQQFRPPREAVIRDLNDVVIVGRGVYEAPDPLSEARKYKEAAFAALIERDST